MNDSPRYDKTLLPVKLNAPVLEVDNEATVENKEELVIVVVLMPMILTLQDAKPNDRIVDPAERLVIPAVSARFDQRWNVYDAQGRIKNVEMGCVRILLSIVHTSSSLTRCLRRTLEPRRRLPCNPGLPRPLSGRTSLHTKHTTRRAAAARNH